MAWVALVPPPAASPPSSLPLVCPLGSAPSRWGFRVTLGFSCHLCADDHATCPFPDTAPSAQPAACSHLDVWLPLHVTGMSHTSSPSPAVKTAPASCQAPSLTSITWPGLLHLTWIVRRLSLLVCVPRLHSHFSSLTHPSQMNSPETVLKKGGISLIPGLLINYKIK